jgi:ketosteroid isomerase-like protein
VIRRAIEAINQRDIDRYLACCTEDIELQTPVAALDGVHHGEDGIRRYFASIEDAGPDFRLALEGTREIGGDRVLAFLRLSASGRTSGISYDTELTNVYDLKDGKIRRVRIYVDRHEALEAVGLSE